MERTRKMVATVSLVGSPLFILGYWLTYPAYGKVHAGDLLRAVATDPDMTQISDVFAFTGTFLAVPATLAFMRVLQEPSPRLAAIGGGAALLGWVALVGALMIDVVAVELAGHRTLFEAVYANPLTVTVNALAGLHIIGGVLIGIALIRTRLIGRSLAIAGTVAGPVHLTANLSGLLWVDAITWLVAAAVGAAVARTMWRTVPARSD
jgi:hypothetical protein